MRFNSGWFKSWREAWDKDLGQNPTLWALWNALLHMATWKESQVIWNGKQRILPPGSIIFGISELAVRWKCSKSVIRKWLHYLHDTHRIVLESCPRGSLATICNWQLYQNESEEACALREHSVGTASSLREHCENLSEEGKKERSKPAVERDRSPCGPISEFSASPEVTKALEGVRQGAQKAWLAAYPDALWLNQEALKALAWLEANPRRRPKKMGPFLGNWFSRGWDRHRMTLPKGKPATVQLLDADDLKKLEDQIHGVANG